MAAWRRKNWFGSLDTLHLAIQIHREIIVKAFNVTESGGESYIAVRECRLLIEWSPVLSTSVSLLLSPRRSLYGRFYALTGSRHSKCSPRSLAMHSRKSPAQPHEKSPLIGVQSPTVSSSAQPSTVCYCT